MANNVGTNPIFMDTDTTIAAGTNWLGVNGGARFTGGRCIRPDKDHRVPRSWPWLPERLPSTALHPRLRQPILFC
jgi:hypothetical protein